MKIISISGKAQHGKDTSAIILKNLFEKEGKKVLIFHYGDLVKYICKSLFDWDGNKDVAGRTLLQKVGTDRIRAQKPNYWVDYLTGLLEVFTDCWDYILIPDCRFPNEIDTLKEKGFDTVSIRVIRQNFVSPLTQEQQNHISETALDDYKMDLVVYNSSTLDELEKVYTDLIENNAINL